MMSTYSVRRNSLNMHITLNKIGLSTLIRVAALVVVMVVVLVLMVMENLEWIFLFYMSQKRRIYYAFLA